MVTTLPSTELEGTVCDNVVNKKETLLHIISPVSLMPGSYIPITQFPQSSTSGVNLVKPVKPVKSPGFCLHFGTLIGPKLATAVWVYLNLMKRHLAGKQ